MTTTDRPAAVRPLSGVPGPKPLPVIGNARDIDTSRLIQSVMELAERYGPIFAIHRPGGASYVVSGLEMVQDLCDDTRFDKLVGTGQREIRKTHRSAGLFTADTDDPLWKSAHDILLPSFSTWAMKGYLDPMVDIAQQLMLKWERLNPDESIDVAADMTRLTLDTIALCGFGYRFNSFYRDSQHPFVAAMMETLAESLKRQRMLPAQIKLRRGAQRRFLANARFMDDTIEEILRARRASGDPGTDLLGHMLVGTDKQGNTLPDHNIVAQCGTFLIAGHETTSGLLSFAVYYLLKHPEVVARAQEEVDRVLGTDPGAAPTVAQIGKLGYIRQILDETLRLWPTAPAFTRQARTPGETVGGWGPFDPGTSIIALTPMLHRLPEVWGEDAREFDPDHMAPERLDALPPNAYRPFGSGQRACIGRQFALQEATLVLGMLLQRFELVDHADYQLRIKETLTIKPEGLTITVRPREGRTWGSAPRPVAVAVAEPRAPALPVTRGDRHGTPLLVLFGSNLGAAEDLATRIARDAGDRGYTARTAALDDAVGELPTEGAVVVVTSSYNGEPPDNAGRFCAWLDSDAASASGVRYTVFGCGNRDWAATYQAVPTRVDAALEARGGTRVYPRGEGDARGDFDAQFSDWYRGLWDALGVALGLDASATATAGGGPRLSVHLEQRRTASPILQSYRGRAATVRVNRELTARAGTPGGRSVRHLEIAVPAGTTYATGDHLGVLPRNPIDLVNRVIARFGLDGGQFATLTATASAPTHLPVGEPYPLLGILAGSVELQDVASRAGLAAVAAALPEGPARDDLARLAGSDDEAKARYREEIAGPRRTLLELLEAHPECELTFAAFLDLLPPLRPRFYSISSSPQVSSDVALTVGVLEGPARSGDGSTYRGVCSGHLAQVPEGGTVFTFVRSPSIAFRPPENPHLPMIMVGAGTGMAPFRGFLQEREALRAHGVPIAPSLLFLGCRDPEDDLLYADELAAFEKAGVATLHPAYSRVPGYPYRYVQHALEGAADDVWAALQQDAVVFVCGNASTMAPGVRAALVSVFRARTGAGEADGAAWLAGLRASNRYLEDIWGETALV
ncbi:bifunctional cytochrome P450/NADPH--P450 reductase [Actinomycetospora cinnamomea]|uniref:Bifunctional cytochrome P450/NADPH--P450 reductase n=1 Tax=Actinomycetospora cinnamomea TaxID=663609 RepID=A0A2U1F6T2_9PSEU|nr:cytochrome P450 [Actinomycetospora cinnamomea]PVZ07893.1 cytochrome P450/NADPH-cytochrome P450 reductase [Actinomycetospora cinnamomea]